MLVQLDFLQGECRYRVVRQRVKGKTPRTAGRSLLDLFIWDDEAERWHADLRAVAARNRTQDRGTAAPRLRDVRAFRVFAAGTGGRLHRQNACRAQTDSGGYSRIGAVAGLRGTRQNALEADRSQPGRDRDRTGKHRAAGSGRTRAAPRSRSRRWRRTPTPCYSAKKRKRVTRRSPGRRSR